MGFPRRHRWVLAVVGAFGLLAVLGVMLYSRSQTRFTRDKYDRIQLGMTEAEVDAVFDGHEIVIPGIFEHIERAGIHSGDSMAVYPPQSLSPEIEARIVTLTRRRCEEIFGLVTDAARSLGIDDVEALIGATASALTRFANNTIHQNVAEKGGYLSVRALINGRTARATTNRDGRTDAPLIGGRPLPIGRYELRFHLADYFAGLGTRQGDPPFLDVVPVRFAVAEPEGQYHVPLLVTPWSYATYRGS